MKKSLLKLTWVLCLVFCGHCFLQAQSLSPRNLSYERTSRDAIKLAWQAPNSNQAYSLYDLTEWIPQTYFYTRSASLAIQETMISDGKYIYSTSINNKAGEFLIFDMSGNFLKTILIEGLPQIYKMTYDGKYFYGVAYDKAGIYKIDINNKKVVSIISTPMRLMHICYIPTLDGGRGGFEAGNPSKGYYLKMDGTYLSDGPNYSDYTACTSTAYYDGKLYAFCQLPGSIKGIVEFDVATTKPTEKILDMGYLEGQAGITDSQMAINLSFVESPNGTMKAIALFYYTTDITAGSVVSFFEIGKRNSLANLQGYNVYKDGTKLNSGLISPDVFSYEDSGLQEETNYLYSAKAVYNGVESSASEALAVRLEASNILPLTEDFSAEEGLLSNYWTVTSGAASPAWTILEDAASVGGDTPYITYTYTSGSYNQYLVSKLLKAPASGTVKLRYDIACNPNGLVNERLSAEVYVDGAWKAVAADLSSAVSAWQTKEYDITSLVQGKEFQVRFRASGIGGGRAYNWYLDNIRVWNAEYAVYGGSVKMVNDPFDGATVRLEKADDPGTVYQATTLPDGTFSFSGVEKGTYKLIVMKDDIPYFAIDEYVINADNTNALITVPKSSVETDTTPIQVLMSQNKTRQLELPLSNTGHKTIEWSAIVEYANTGTGKEIGMNNIAVAPSWEPTKTFNTGKSTEAYITLHQNHIYSIGAVSYNPSSFVLNKYTTDGLLVEAYTISTPYANVAGLVSDGNKLYQITSVLYDGTPSKLIPINFETQKVDEANAIVTDNNEIERVLYATYDPVNDGFYIGSEHVVYRINRAGKVQDTYNGIVGTVTRGVVLDTFSKDGPYLWLFCQKTLPDHGGSTDVVSLLQLSLKTGELTNTSHSPMDVPGYDGSLTSAPAGFFGTTSLIPGYFTIGGAMSFSSPMKKEKTMYFLYNMFPYENWITLQEKDGKMDPGSSDNMVFELNTGNLNDGDEREGTLVIKSDYYGADVQIPVKLIVDNDGEENCFSPSGLNATVTPSYQVNLSWALASEATQVKGYKLYRNGVLINKDLITTKNYTDATPGMGEQKYTVRTVYEFGCESYDSNEATIFVENPSIVQKVDNLQAEVINQRHTQLSWKTPQYGDGIFDDFETYKAFAIDNIGDWKLVDGDNSWTYMFGNLAFLNQGYKMAYIVFNPKQCAPASSIATHDGKNQVLACFSSNVDKLANNDWLISPELSLDRDFELSFMAKTHLPTYGAEKVNIGYSMTGNAPEDFVFVNGEVPINIGDIWWRYEYRIPANAKYVAINCVSQNNFMLMLDNIYIGYPEYYSDLKGYNIYRNGTKVNDALLNSNIYMDYNLEDGTYTYEIEALFANGTSSKAQTGLLVINNSHEATPPRDLTGEVSSDNIAALTWTPPLWAGQDQLRYDNGIPYSSTGSEEDVEQLIGIKWNNSELDAYQGYTIAGVQFHIAEPVPYAVPFLFENGTLVRVGDEMQVESGKYTTYMFDTPVMIKPEAEYIIGYATNPAEGTYPFSYDAGPSTPGKSDLVSTDGRNWYSLFATQGGAYNFNWNIAAIVELRGTIDGDSYRSTPVSSRIAKDNVTMPMPKHRQKLQPATNKPPMFTPNATTDKLLGYNIYRNDVKINDTPLRALNYVDAEPLSESRNYFVTAIYETSGEKASNRITLSTMGMDEDQGVTLVYPNPVKDELYVKGTYNSLSLISAEGKEVYNRQGSAVGVSKINVQNLPDGFYLLLLKTGDKTKYYKVIIQK
ncbi:hypothetical protein M2132_001659 [Dysgonomonas sp. PH5-45]|uniref:T9SS-dependent choice-of-anchor J family protein n=1 Tax=unclassified Dysgonomonas TaxID=2630389 RepID=UPI002476B858|nr:MULTISPECIES: choice-of-anchor J domain-containing protein [unclassified Dysgonomonas]MDH6355318.1 hypothetical protein [Dysgonomonas sp. PH5-45]MDH6388216.1 hypothetical protein [Dysgonomonas sp. PH5-37]